MLHLVFFVALGECQQNLRQTFLTAKDPKLNLAFQSTWNLLSLLNGWATCHSDKQVHLSLSNLTNYTLNAPPFLYPYGHHAIQTSHLHNAMVLLGEKHNMVIPLLAFLKCSLILDKVRGMWHGSPCMVWTETLISKPSVLIFFLVCQPHQPCVHSAPFWLQELCTMVPFLEGSWSIMSQLSCSSKHQSFRELFSDPLKVRTWWPSHLPLLLDTPGLWHLQGSTSPGSLNSLVMMVLGQSRKAFPNTWIILTRAQRLHNSQDSTCLV